MNGEDDSQRQLRLLRHYRKDIVEDLEVHRVIPFLLESLVLIHDDKERVENQVIKPILVSLLLHYFVRSSKF